MSEDSTQCVQRAGGPILAEPEEVDPGQTAERTEVPEMSVQVGKPAPDFEATAYVDRAFKNIKLSDYKGKWVTLCFYPRDFTFV
jgi:hypothetical protein